MQKKWLYMTATSLTLLSLSIADTVAAMSIPYGWYVEGNIGTSNTSNDNYPSGTSTSTSGVGWNANVGYKFMPYFAAEAGYTRYSDTTIKSNGGTIATDKHYAFDLAGKGIVPISDSPVELFAKLGIQNLYSKTSISNSTAANSVGLSSGTNNTFGAYLGTGVQYSFTPAFGANLQWMRAVGDDSTGTMSLLSIGISYFVA